MAEQTTPYRATLGAILTITTGTMVSPLKEFYGLQDFLVGRSLLTHERTTGWDRQKDALLQQFPDLVGVSAPEFLTDATGSKEASARAWVDSVAAELGWSEADVQPVDGCEVDPGDAFNRAHGGLLSRAHAPGTAEISTERPGPGYSPPPLAVHQQGHIHRWEEPCTTACPGHSIRDTQGEHTPTTAWLVTELGLNLPEAPREGQPHPEATPVGPFPTFEEALNWARARVQEYGGSGTCSVAPLIPPATDPTTITAVRPDAKEAPSETSVSAVPDGTILTVPTGYETDPATGLNTGTDLVPVLIRYDPALPTLGQTIFGATHGPARVITMREWNEQVFLHELLHVAVGPYFEGGYHNTLGDPHGHRLVNRVEVLLWDIGWRLAPTEQAAAQTASTPGAEVSPVADHQAEKDGRGLHDKYRVERVNDPDGKHASCSYFVLDLRHDPLALGALRRYAHDARNAGYVALADDLDRLLSSPPYPRSDAVTSHPLYLPAATTPAPWPGATATTEET
jgi:hypothetical protein